MSRAIALAVAALVLGTACDRPSEPSGTAELPAGPRDLPPPDQIVEDGRHVITVEGVRKAVLEAEQLYFYNRDGRVVGDTITVNFFDDEGRPSSVLTARSGEMEQASQRMVARGEVFVRGTGSTIRTDELVYDPTTDRISSDKPTEINQQGNRIRGRGFSSDPALENIRITGGSAVLRSEPRLGPERAPADTAGRAPAEAPVPAPPDTVAGAEREGR